MKVRKNKIGKKLLSAAVAAALMLPCCVVLPASAETADSAEIKAAQNDRVGKLPEESGAGSTASVPRICYTLPCDSWTRDFIMTEDSDYYFCTIPALNAQFYVYDKASGALSGYAGIDESGDSNVNVAFSSVAGSSYKRLTASTSAGSSSVDIRVDKTSGLIYGVCGKAETTYAENVKLKAKTAGETDYTVYESTGADGERYQTYTFDTTSVDFVVLQGDTASENFVYDVSASSLNGVELVQGQDGSYTANVKQGSGCDKVEFFVDRSLMTVTAKAVKSDISEEENRTYYLEGRFACDTANGSVSVNGSAWSDNSAAVALSASETAGLYKLETNSTIAQLTASSGSAYAFYVREGTRYPQTALGTSYTPGANTSLAAVEPGQRLDAVSAQTSGGGFYFNDKTKNVGKVTLWFDITNQNAPVFYYTLRFDGISAKAMCGDDDKGSINVSVEPSGTVSLPEGAAVTAPQVVEENGLSYAFTKWISVDGTGTFEDENSAQTTFFPANDNDTAAAVYKVGYSIVCENAEHGAVTSSSEMVGVSEDYTLTVTPDDGYTLTSLIVDGVEKINDTVGRTEYTGTMGDHSVTVSAVFEPAREVYFYAAVPTKWTELHRKIAATADGLTVEPETIFDNVVLYDRASNSEVNSGATFYVNLFKAEEHSKITIGHPENEDGTVTSGCCGHKILSGELVEGSCYYYYSASSDNNFSGIVAPTLPEITCLTAEPKTGEPVELSVSVTDSNGKTAGQEAYTTAISAEDPDGIAVTVENNKFTPEKPGTYTVKAWAEADGVKSAVASAAIEVEAANPQPQTITVEFKYYGRDNDDRSEMSDEAVTISEEAVVYNGDLDDAVLRAYTDVSGKLEETENVMSSYYFNITQELAVDTVKASTNYHEPKTNGGEIERDNKGIAVYKTYGECYSDEELSFHTDRYGNLTDQEKWVTFYGQNGAIEESAAKANPENVTKVVIWGFNNPKLYNVNLTYADKNSNVSSMTKVNEAKGLFKPENADAKTYGAFYNMLLDSAADYSDSGYLSHYNLNEYFGAPDNPASDARLNVNDNVYVFDGWYDITDGKCLKVSTDEVYTIRVSGDTGLTALYRTASEEPAEPEVTVTGLAEEKFVENDVEYVGITDIVNVFNADDVQKVAVVYARMRSESIDSEQLRLTITEKITQRNDKGRTVQTVDVGSDMVNLIIDIYEIVPDSADENAAEYKVQLNNKNRAAFSTSFTAESAKTGGANAIIQMFAAADNNGDWTLSENSIPYISTGDGE